MHKSPGIYLIAEEYPGKLQLRGRLIKAVRLIIASNGIPYFQIMQVGSYSTSRRKKKEKKKRVREEFLKKTKLIIQKVFLINETLG